MSWQLATVNLMVGVTFLFYWLSFQYDSEEHQILKLFYQMMGLASTLGAILGVKFIIPASETALLDYYNMFLLIAIVIMLLVFFYWFGYTTLSIMNGLLKDMWKNLKMRGDWRGRNGGRVRLGQ